MNLITTLKNEHQTILGIFTEFNQLIKKDESVLELINELDKILAGHIEKENKYIYYKFSQASEEELKKLGMIFSDQMKIYAVEIIALLGEIKNADGRLNAELLARYEKSSERLTSRLSIEEAILFPAYTKYFGETEI